MVPHRDVCFYNFFLFTDIVQRPPVTVCREGTRGRGFRRSDQRLYARTHQSREIGHDLVTLSPIRAESKNTNETLSADYHHSAAGQ